MGRGLDAARALLVRPLAPSRLFLAGTAHAHLLPLQLSLVGRSLPRCPGTGTWAQVRLGCGEVLQRSLVRAPKSWGSVPNIKAFQILLEVFLKS